MEEECEIFIEKTPENILRMRYLQSVFPNALFVMVVRDPYVLSAALRKKTERFGHTIETIAENINNIYGLMGEDQEKVANILVFTYESLTADPERAFEQIRERLGCPFNDGKLSIPRSFRNINDHYLNYLDRDDINTISSICGKMIARYDYTAPREVNLLAKRIRTLRKLVHRVFENRVRRPLFRKTLEIRGKIWRR